MQERAGITKKMNAGRVPAGINIPLYATGEMMAMISSSKQSCTNVLLTQGAEILIMIKNNAKGRSSQKVKRVINSIED